MVPLIEKRQERYHLLEVVPENPIYKPNTGGTTRYQSGTTVPPGTCDPVGSTRGTTPLRGGTSSTTDAGTNGGNKRHSQQSTTSSEKTAGDKEAPPDSLADKRHTEQGDSEEDVVGQNSRRLTDEEVERVKRLMCEGMPAATARAEVLGKGEED